MKPLHLTLLVCLVASSSFAGPIPQTVEETWAGFDPRAEPLETEILRETVEDGIVLRTIRYVVGTFDGKKTRVAAFHAFPAGVDDLPGLVQVHGGGQYPRKHTALFWAARGYAIVAVNWGEKVIDQPEDPNTDWAGIPAGFLDPKHHNGVEPGEGTIHDVPHPWNSSWLLYSAAARRAITMLEEQPACDGERIGLMGHSMGGRLTVLTAIDPRVKAASPSVGGSGFLYEDLAGIPGSARRMETGLARDLYLRTLDCKDYWPLIPCPVMFLGATNDFNSPMELVIRGFRRLPHPTGALSFTPHMNHRFTVDNYAARVRWFDTHLKGNFAFPQNAPAQLHLTAENGIPRFIVRPDLAVPHKLESVRIYYGYDRDPRARFWRSAEVERNGDVFSAACPVVDLNKPLFAFGNVTYETGDPIAMPAGYAENSLLTVTSEPRQAFPHQLREAGVKATGERQRLIEDFAHGWRDWSLVAAENHHHWNFETHKVCDPAYFGPVGASLALEVQTTEPGNTLAVILDVDRWRGYTGRKARRYTALVELPDAGSHQVSLPMNRFVDEEGELLQTYDFVTSLILTPGQKERPEAVPDPWQGVVPTFRNVRWVGGQFAPRPRPYLKIGSSEIDAILSKIEPDDYRLRSMIHEIVSSPLFRTK